jgi:hypothetical protein
MAIPSEVLVRGPMTRGLGDGPEARLPCPPSDPLPSCTAFEFAVFAPIYRLTSGEAELGFPRGEPGAWKGTWVDLWRFFGARIRRVDDDGKKRNAAAG